MLNTSEEIFPSLGDLEATAAKRVPADLWSYIQGGAAEEATLAANREAFRRRALRPKVLTGLREVDLTSTLLGSEVAAPLYVSAMAYLGAIHPEGEIGVARACAAAGVPMMVGTLSSQSLESVARGAPAGPRWFQLYLQPKFQESRRLIERAEAAGYDAIVLTVDAPLFGRRDRQLRSGFGIDNVPPLGNGPGIVVPPRAPKHVGHSYLLQDDRCVGWDILEKIASVTSLPIVVKGPLTAKDARLAVAHGARGLVVSNHGGRQLDGAPATLDALHEVSVAAGRRAEVYLDGGVRRGRDVATALALGARAVGLGRPVLWALALGGEAGVKRYLDLLFEEIANTLFLLGRGRPRDLKADVVGPYRDGPRRGG